MSSPKVWGPALWYILHTYTEKLGNQSNEILSTDQRRAWINFLKSIEAAIPCAKCRAHYKEWRIKHPIDNFSYYMGDTLKQRAREWVWGLHEDVNKENGLTGVPIEKLPEMYGSIDQHIMRMNLENCNNDFKKAMLHSLLAPPAYHNFMKYLALLRATS
jgi:hypothetical protein